jgi:recombination protein RecR
MLLPESVQNLINALSRLPGIGPKSASRLAFHLLRSDSGLAEELAAAFRELKANVGYCARCFNITSGSRDFCEICADPRRTSEMICVVEEPLDVLALERTGGYSGQYHILQGVLSPIEGIGPENIRIAELLRRVQAGGVREIIIATNPSMEGDYTGMYIRQQLQDSGVQVTRIARGLPVGGDLEYADQNTLLKALVGRQAMT